MLRILTFLGGHATWMLFAGVFIGLALPGLASLARPLLAPAVVTILCATLLRVDWRAMGEYARRPVLATLLTIWLMLVSPVVTWLILKAVPGPQPLEIALVLMAAAPPILAAAAIALMLGLDGALALVAGMVATLLTPLTLPPLALALLGLDLEIGVWTFMGRLGAIIGVAFAAALGIRKFLGNERIVKLSMPLDGLVVILLLVFAVAIMDGVTETLLSRPLTVLLWLAAAFVANPLLQLLGMMAFCWLGRRGALTAGLITGNCNMGLILAALPPEADFDVVLYFAIAQIPMYMLPALILPLYRRLLATNADSTRARD
jgi:BASS family bile acid:Na+ symporter